MSYDQYDRQLQLAPIVSDNLELSAGMSRGRRWFNQVVMQCSHPMLRSKPDWVHLPGSGLASPVGVAGQPA